MVALDLFVASRDYRYRILVFLAAAVSIAKTPYYQVEI